MGFYRISRLSPDYVDVAFDRLVEEADYQHTTELFGGKSSAGRSLEDFIPKSENDFLEYAELLAQKIRPFEVHLLQSYLGGILFIFDIIHFAYFISCTFVRCSCTLWKLNFVSTLQLGYFGAPGLRVCSYAFARMYESFHFAGCLG